MWSAPTDAKGEMAQKIGNRWGWGVAVVVGLLVLCLGFGLAVGVHPLLGGVVFCVAAPLVGLLAGKLAYAISYRLMYRGVSKQTIPTSA